MAGFDSDAMNASLLSTAANSTSPNITQSPSETLHVTEIGIATLIFVVGLPLNVLVIWVLCFHSTRRNSFGIYVLNLAFADLVLVMRIPLAIAYLVAYNQWHFGSITCKIIMFLRVLGLYAGAFLLSAISLERCLCLLHPVWYRLRRPVWVVPTICGFLWCLSSFLSFPYLQYSQVIDDQCHDKFESPIGLFVTETVLGFLMPLLLFVSCNLLVLLKAKREYSLKNAKLFKVLTFTMVVFLTFWVPYHVFRFLMSLYSSSPEDKAYGVAAKGVYFSLYLVYLKSSLNPVLYVLAGKDLRNTVKASLMSAIEGLFSDEASDLKQRRSLKAQESQV
ncbi:C3a anaphylatoxin chemotactic receptor [Polyodon spathula]|uniref:C3a anaphylatoxin chemotactic receptor n=1 Tax=Polyodon spathula TaxID=7913 RepID=UPI001B7E5C27|nr:C3a anaphylatoxin chemotactic receptor [Polyodon spathula]